MRASHPPTAFPALLQSFFCQRLIAQRNESPRTGASYRDTFRLLFRFLQQDINQAPRIRVSS